MNPAFTTLVNQASHLDPSLRTKHNSFEQIFAHILLGCTSKKNVLITQLAFQANRMAVVKMQSK